MFATARHRPPPPNLNLFGRLHHFDASTSTSARLCACLADCGTCSSNSTLFCILLLFFYSQSYFAISIHLFVSALHWPLFPFGSLFCLDACPCLAQLALLLAVPQSLSPSPAATHHASDSAAHQTTNHRLVSFLLSVATLSANVQT